MSRKKPWWIGYVATILLDAALTAGLLLVEPHFPLGKYPIAYVVIIMIVAYLFGEGPAALSFVSGLLIFTYYFVEPRRELSPAEVSPQGWASLAAYGIGAFIIGFGSIAVRRSRQRIERLLSEVSQSNQRIESLIENTPMGVIEWSADYHITRWAGEAERIFGWSAEEAIGRRIDELNWVHEEDWGTVQQVMADMLSGERPRTVNKNRNIRKDGSVIYCEWYNSTVRDTQADLVSVLSLVLDVTERTLAEKVLRRYQLLSERARDIVLFVRPDGGIMEANDAAVKAYGYTHDELVGLSIYDLRSPESAPSIMEQMEKADASGILFEVMHRRKDGSTFPVEVNSQGADVEGQRVLLSIIRDVSERVKLRQALENQVSLLQRALLPERPAIRGGYDIATRYVAGRAGEEIGGDFYDVFETEDGKVGILIGDVSGKGIESAALAAATRSTLRAFAYDTSAAGEALTHTNSVLVAQHGGLDTFVTVFVAILDLESGRMVYANAGHPAAMVRHADTGTVEYLSFGQPPLLVREGEIYDEYTCGMLPGDRLVLYTDGVSEARHGREMFGVEGIERVIAEQTEASAEQLVDTVFENAVRHANGHIEDDVAMIVIDRPPA